MLKISFPEVGTLFPSVFLDFFLNYIVNQALGASLLLPHEAGAFPPRAKTFSNT